MSGNIASDGNRIAIHGSFTTIEMPRLVAAMHNLIAVRGYQDLTLDFSHCDAAFQASMLGIVARAQAYWADGVDIALILPVAPLLRRLFINANWAHLIDFRAYPETEYRGYKHVPATKFTTSTEQYAAVNRILTALLTALSDFDRSDLRAIEWSLNEITDNVINHAEASTGGFVQITNYTGHAKRVEFVVSDAGIGIPASLRLGHSELTSDSEALDRAIREGVTRDKQFGQGNGLYGTWRITQLSGGKLEVYSGNASLLSLQQQKAVRIENQPIPFRGTLVVAGIRYAQPLDLSEALRFGGKKHLPADFVEQIYEMDAEGNVKFNLGKESTGFGTRSAGEPVRRRLINLARVSGQNRIVVDCADVALMSSSYADEVFGKLFSELGAISFSQKFNFENVDPLVEQLINKAVTQRLGER